MIEWIKAARWHASIVHLGEMWVVWLPAYAATRSASAAACAVVAWYWSRKMTEVRAAASPGNLLAAWRLGWWPWRWPWPLQLDFYVPALLALLIVVLFKEN
jgi:hypothetical protein